MTFAVITVNLNYSKNTNEHHIDVIFSTHTSIKRVTIRKYWLVPYLLLLLCISIN